MNNFQIDMAFKNNENDVRYKKVAFTKKVMNKFTINVLHSVLAFYRFFYLGVFWIMNHYTVLHFAFSPME
jgi:hypothetical protein